MGSSRVFKAELPGICNGKMRMANCTCMPSAFFVKHGSGEAKQSVGAGHKLTGLAETLYIMNNMLQSLPAADATAEGQLTLGTQGSQLEQDTSSQHLLRKLTSCFKAGQQLEARAARAHETHGSQLGQGISSQYLLRHHV